MADEHEPKATENTDQIALIDAADYLEAVIESLSGTAAAQAMGLTKHLRNLANPPEQNTEGE